MNFRLSFATLFVLVTFFSLQNAFAGEVVESVGGACRKALFSEAHRQVPPSEDDFLFQGFYDEVETYDENEFTLTYGFNEECAASVKFKIRPTKVIHVNSELRAVECRIIEVIDGGAECG